LEASPGYWCGRLLAILDRIHVEAHDSKTSSSPANRSYGSASTTPALIFPQLCKLARVHLAKVKGKRDKYGNKAEERLEFGYPWFDPPLQGLADVCAKLRTTGAEFPRTLTLEQQGHFAIGFYYERCCPWPKYGSGSDSKTTDDSPSQ
jgi:CRISPR-associated protein Csd1